METLIYFTAYWILISWLAWYVNRPKSFKITFGDQEYACRVLSETLIETDRAILKLKTAMDRGV